MGYKFIIAEEAGRSRALAIIKNLKLDKPQEFTLKTYRRNRSIEQHNTYRWWLKIFADELGDDSDSLHEQLKQKFLIPILERENEDYQHLMKAVNRHREKGQHKEAAFWENIVRKKASTTDLDTKQFTEYLSLVESFAAQFGIALPQPDPNRHSKS